MTKDINNSILDLIALKENRKTVIKPKGKHIVYRPIFEADVFREAALYRFIELIESAYSLYKGNLLIGAICCVRAAYETVAVLWFVNSKLSHLAKTKDISHHLDVMKRLLFGWSNTPNLPEKINVLKCLDSLDKNTKGEYRKHYEKLCEFAHPNYCGTLGAYTSHNYAEKEVFYSQYPRCEDELKATIELTIISSMEIINHIEKEYNTVAKLAIDASIWLYENGKLISAYEKLSI